MAVPSGNVRPHAPPMRRSWKKEEEEEGEEEGGEGGGGEMISNHKIFLVFQNLDYLQL